MSIPTTTHSLSIELLDFFRLLQNVIQVTLISVLHPLYLFSCLNPIPLALVVISASRQDLRGG
jgi:hypothetical protein